MGQEDPTTESDLVPKVGTFMLLLGIFSLIFFVASDFARQADFDWLFVGMVLLGFGIVLRRKAPSPPPAGRFGMIRRMREDSKKRKEDKAKKAKK